MLPDIFSIIDLIGEREFLLFQTCFQHEFFESICVDRNIDPSPIFDLVIANSSSRR